MWANSCVNSLRNRTEPIAQVCLTPHKHVKLSTNCQHLFAQVFTKIPEYPASLPTLPDACKDQSFKLTYTN